MNIENYFESDEFLRILSQLRKYFKKGSPYDNQSLIGYLINISIIYSVIFRNDNGLSITGLEEFLKKVIANISSMNTNNISSIIDDYNLKLYITSLYADKILESLNLSRDSLHDKKTYEETCSYIIKRIKSADYIYHAFNSTFFDSIKENGINPNIRFTSQEEINTINNIFEKYGITLIAGWQKLNCEKKVSYSNSPSVSYYYGTSSPEWFSQFTGQSFNFVLNGKYNKDAFFLNDYESAKNNLITLMNEKHFSNDDMKTVLNFFDKNWKIYANKNPMLAIIPRKVDSKQIDSYITFILNDGYFNKFDSVLKFILSDPRVDCHSSETIDTKDAIYVKLPNYCELMKKISMIELDDADDRTFSM